MVLGLGLGLGGSGMARASEAQATKDEAKVYATRGTLRSFGPDRAFVNIAHEDIPGFMKAMTMSFEPDGRNQLDGLAVGDVVAFAFEARDDGRYVLRWIRREPEVRK